MASYEISGFMTYRVDADEQKEMLANFSAAIVEETTITDGLNSETILSIAGFLPDPEANGKAIALPLIQIPATSFPGLQWAIQNWGSRCIILPGSSIKEDLRCAIQLHSQPTRRTIYRNTGWMEKDGFLQFLHAGGSISKDGNDPTVSVKLPNELTRYRILSEATLKDAWNASISLLSLAPPEVSWPLWAATFVALFGPVDFAIHLTGRTGTFKSELMSLFQSHFGPDFDARHLPGSWSSTANALEAQAFFAKDLPMTIDDFVPAGTSWQVRSYQTTADKIIRAQGNQAGRARLTDVSSLQSTYYPRGIIFSTGEDTPEGHSVRARMLILELSPDDISTKNLSAAQKKRKDFAALTSALIQHIAEVRPSLIERTEQIRDTMLTVGHSRTPPTIARLLATVEYILDWAYSSKLISAKEAGKMKKHAEANLKQAGESQTPFLTSADPCEQFLTALRQVLSSGLAHIRTLNGGIPAQPEQLGWTMEDSSGDLPTYKAHGPNIGWISWGDEELYLDAIAGYSIVRKIAGGELALSKQTMMKRLKEAGHLTRSDDARQRNTVRITAQGHPRLVLAINSARINPEEDVK